LDGGTPREATMVGSTPGGTMRRLWPTSMTCGGSRLFQRAMSFQFWPLSRPMRMSVSPGLTM
jgi:hypothetical protein